MSPRTPEPVGPALAALGALVDRSVVQIADAARDARAFDRETIRTASDVWDNGTLPLFRAVIGHTGGERERRARAALAWMVRLRPGHWDWMLEQGAVAGHRIDALVQPPPVRSETSYRDHRDAVRPAYSRLTSRTVTELAADYELDAATVRHLRIERAGSRLGGLLTLELARSYFCEESTPRLPTLDVRLDGLTAVEVDTGTTPGVRLDTDARGVAIGVGNGVLRARAASLYLDDSCWHLSDAGRRADARTPPRRGGSRFGQEPREGELEGSARGAATFLLWSMRMIRMVRYPQEITRVPVEAYCRALQGAGQDILDAGTLPPEQREAAFRSLVATWLRRGGNALAPDWKLLLKHVPDAGDLAREVRADLSAEGTCPPAREVGDVPERAGLRMVSYTAEHTAGRSRREASAVVHLAVPSQEGTPWRLCVVTATDPVRLRARTEAFDGAGRVHMDRGEAERETLVAGDGALTLDAHAWCVKGTQDENGAGRGIRPAPQ